MPRVSDARPCQWPPSGRWNEDVPTLEQLCGSVTIPLPERFEETAARIEERWHRLGGFVAGCFERVEVDPHGVVAWFKGGESEPTALVADSAARVSFVREDGASLLRELLGAHEFVGVDDLHSGSSTSFQVFRTKAGCRVRVHTYGSGRVELSERAASMIYTAVAKLGGTLRSVQAGLVRDGVTRLDIEIESDEVRAVMVLFDDAGEITVSSSPPGLDVALLEATDGCADAAFEYVRRTD